MDKVALKVVVAGRTYPLTVLQSEVTRVEKAANDINRAIQQLQDNFAVRDMQDLLAMTALQLSTKQSKPTSASSVHQELADFSEAEFALKKLAEDLEKLV